jgi:gas vesicle protein
MGQRPDELRPREIIVRAGGIQEESVASQTGSAPDDAELEAAREDIERTRADMTSTIDAIQDRLDPEVLSEQAKDTAHDVTDYAIREAKEAAREITDHAVVQARAAVQDITGQARAALREATIGKVETMARTASDTAGGWRESVMDTIKANPMPAALVGLGLGWMLLNRPSSPSSNRAYRRYGYAPTGYGSDMSGYAGYYAGGYSQTSERPGSGSVTEEAQQTIGRMADRTQQTASQVVDQAQSTAGQVAGQVQDTAGQVVDQVQETGGQVVEQVQQQASRAQSFLQRQLEENPLLVGAVAVAIGGVLAGTMPSTSREDQMLGQTRDRLVGTAKEFTQDTMQKVGRVVDEAQSAAKEEAREQSLVPEGGATGSAS